MKQSTNRRTKTYVTPLVETISMEPATLIAASTEKVKTEGSSISRRRDSRYDED